MTRTIIGIALALILAPGTALAQAGQQKTPQRPDLNAPDYKNGGPVSRQIPRERHNSGASGNQQDTQSVVSQKRIPRMREKQQQRRQQMQKRQNAGQRGAPSRPGAQSNPQKRKAQQPQQRRQQPRQRGAGQQNTKRFADIDANNDGKITLQEFKDQTSGGQVKPVFKRIDRNGDGTITRKEARQYANNTKKSGRNGRGAAR